MARDAQGNPLALLEFAGSTGPYDDRPGVGAGWGSGPDEMSAARIGAEFVQLDVTDDASVNAAVKTPATSAGHLDILINNAGILGEVAAPEDMTADQLRPVYETNVFVLVRVTHAFLPLLRAASNPSVIIVTSGLGSFTLVRDPERVESQYVLAAYGSSRSAVTMLTMQYAESITDVRFNAVDPGQTTTGLTGEVGQRIEEGAEAGTHGYPGGGYAWLPWGRTRPPARSPTAQVPPMVMRWPDGGRPFTGPDRVLVTEHRRPARPHPDPTP